MFPISVRKIIFDLDGTLVDSAPDLHAATNHVLTSIGRASVALDQVRHMVGYGALRLIELGLEATGGQEGYKAEDLRPLFLEYYGQHVTDHTVPFDGVFDTLREFQDAGIKMAVCTNKPAVLAEPVLRNVGLEPFFGAFTGGDSFSFKKPDPRHILETAAMLPGEGPVLMVGDSRPDIEGAKAAKLASIAVSFGYSQTPVEELGADQVIDNFSELAALIKPV